MHTTASRTKRRLAVSATAAALVTLLTACSGGGAPTPTQTSEPTSAPEPTKPAPEKDTISITQAPLTYYAPIWIADEMGYFADEGISIEFAESVPTGAGQIAMITSGQVDVIASAPASMIQALSEGLRTQFISNIANFAETDEADSGAIIVTVDSPIQHPRELNGKRVGVSSIQSMQQSKIAAVIDHDGGDSSTVEFIQVPPASMPGLLQTGEIDAASPLQPGLTALLESGDFRRIHGANWVALGGVSGLSVASTPEWIEEHPNTARAIQAAVARGVEWANDPANREALNELLASRMNADVEVLKKWIPDPYASVITLESLEKLQQHLIDYGLLAQPVDLTLMLWEG